MIVLNQQEREYHENFMKEAIGQARLAAVNLDVPIGAVIVKEDKIIGRGYNQVELKKDSTAHAEILAIQSATAIAGYKHLLDATIYVTLEPCPMCAGAIVLARLKRIVFGAYDPKNGACGTLYSIPKDGRLNHQCEIRGGILDVECSDLLKNFFRELRK
ncbi:MAG: tRNA adenosine(34) deaminase TadA [Bacteroidota bacterium]|jgi:tRNA(adenine34) deaminase